MITLSSQKIPEGFANVNDHSVLTDTPAEHEIIVNLKYFSEDNFIGRMIPGYKKNVGIMTVEAVRALNEAQKKFNKLGYTIVLYDAYRPQEAVSYFVEWMSDESDTLRKKEHYPYIDKKSDMKDIYVASKSGHSRGSTIDMSIIEIGKELSKTTKYKPRPFNDKVYPYLKDGTVDCGTSFDLMDPMSHRNNTIVSEDQFANRQLIEKIMVDCGFVPLPEEWWHFTLDNEPYKDKYFEFPVDE